jgi:SSS family transporter
VGLWSSLLASIGSANEPPLEPVFDFVSGTSSNLPHTPLQVGFSEGKLVALAVEAGTAQAQVYARPPEETEAWKQVGEVPSPPAHAATAISPAGLIFIGGTRNGDTTTEVSRLALVDGRPEWTSLTDLPMPLDSIAATVASGYLWVTGTDLSGHPTFLRLEVSKDLSFTQKLLAGLGFKFRGPSPEWQKLDPWNGSPLRESRLIFSFESVHLFGLGADGFPVGYGYHPVRGWRSLTPPENWNATFTLAPLGESHLYAFEGSPRASSNSPILAYHTLTDTWVEVGQWDNPTADLAQAVSVGETIYLISASGMTSVTVRPPPNNYGWVDHAVVAAYLLGMVFMGAWFVRRERNTKDYFRASNKVPWWAIGMSLFATAASAISLMTMPGKSYSTDWTFFAISIYSVLCLPISLFVLAPLIRKLNISTSNEYLELRFGLTARMVGSVIYMVNQILGRMAPVIFLPSIAMAAITGIDIWIWILVIGSVTTIYTFLGGLSAVIWTDTIQGLIMLGTVAGCLVLILFKIDMPIDQIWSTLQDNNKLHVFDWGMDVTQPTVFMMLIGTIFLTLLGIGDQNYVQRVQAAPSLADAKKAVATQMAVAIPINLLLFGLGTALYLYYRMHPVELNPVMKTDGIYPLFAAQHLPVGVSGLVIAALLAASMSTISSAICSVANLGIDDFYRRFKSEVNESFALLLARVLSILVGVCGIIGALFLANSNSKSVWDAALIITGLITNGTVGLFGLGLLTKRAHEAGALLGVVAGMMVTVYLQAYTPVTFWLYQVVGSIVTFVVGYGLSLALPLPRKPIAGLTVYTLDQPRRNL